MAREEGRGRGRGQGRGRGEREERDEFVDKLVAINRVAKVVKGGKNFGFAALGCRWRPKRPCRFRQGQGARSA